MTIPALLAHPDIDLILAMGWREYLLSKYYYAGDHIGWLEYPQNKGEKQGVLSAPPEDVAGVIKRLRCAKALEINSGEHHALTGEEHWQTDLGQIAADLLEKLSKPAPADVEGLCDHLDAFAERGDVPSAARELMRNASAAIRARSEGQ